MGCLKKRPASGAVNKIPQKIERVSDRSRLGQRHLREVDAGRTALLQLKPYIEDSSMIERHSGITSSGPWSRYFVGFHSPRHLDVFAALLPDGCFGGKRLPMDVIVGAVGVIGA